MISKCATSPKLWKLNFPLSSRCRCSMNSAMVKISEVSAFPSSSRAITASFLFRAATKEMSPFGQRQQKTGIFGLLLSLQLKLGYHEISVGAVYDRVFFPESTKNARSQTAPTEIKSVSNL